MPGTVTCLHQNHRVMKELRMSWVSDSSGDVSGTDTPVVSGELFNVTFIPDGGGTQPTNLYDVVLNDEHGIDVVGGDGGNLSNTTTSQTAPVHGSTAGAAANVVRHGIDGPLSLVVSNAGDAKGGTVILHYR